MVHGDHHHPVLLGQVEAVVAHLLDGGARGVPAPVDPEEHGLLGGGVAPVRPHVQVLAVLGRGPEPVGDHHLPSGHGLVQHRAIHAVAARVLHPLPGGHGLGHLEALGLGVPNAEKVIHPVEPEPPQLALGGGDDGAFLAHDKFFHRGQPPKTVSLGLQYTRFFPKKQGSVLSKTVPSAPGKTSAPLAFFPHRCYS